MAEPSHCKVSRIYFNYYLTNVEAQPQFGINVMPEDLSRFPTLPYNAVAFPLDTTRGQQLKLHAEFTGPANGSLLVRAVTIEDLQATLTAVGVDTGKEELTGQIRLLGDVEPTRVDFDKDGNSYVPIDRSQPNHPFQESGVIELTIEQSNIREIRADWQLWQWQFSADGGKTWQNAGGLLHEGISVHRIFVTKSAANWPWTSYEETIKTVEGRNFVSRPPQVGLLEWACKWAQGETTEEGIASRITARIFDCGRFRYGTGMNNYTSLFDSAYFDCGRFIDRLNGNFGRGPNVNCVDCAHMVISLTNALGCDLQAGEIRNPDGSPIDLNPLTLIGYDKVTDLTTFQFHLIAIRPVAHLQEQYLVFDACTKFDMTIYKEIAQGDPDKGGRKLTPIQTKYIAMFYGRDVLRMLGGDLLDELDLADIR